MKHICKHKFAEDGKMIVDKPVTTKDQLQYNFDWLEALQKNKEIKRDQR